MFKKLINHSESIQVEMGNSALQDIIPSNDVVIPKKPGQKRLSSICKILICIFILGLIAIGVVVLALILAYYRNAFINYITKSSEPHLLPLSNKTRVLSIYQENLTAISNEQNWEKITVKPTSNNQQNQISSIKQEHEPISISTPSMEPDPSSSIMINKQSMPPSAMMTVQEHVETSTMTADTFTSTFIIQETRDDDTTMPENTLFTSYIDFQPSTYKNKKKQISTKQNTAAEEEDDVINDFLFS